jgi:hypothetical protein
MVKRSQSHPRKIPGKLTAPQLTKMLGLPQHWLYDRINNGTIQITKDSTGLYLFPDEPETLIMIQHLNDGKLQTVRF